MGFDTAVFYDIENLIGGYRNPEMLEALSLKKIHKQFESLDIGNIAVQRAYANWSTPSLNVLKDDIVELGINPVQMFGFGRGHDKNASDIQLVIDAMDIACNRPFIKHFIIVSGDGGFSALARQLHEYGKSVTGCAYHHVTNKVLESVCDNFFLIEDNRTKPIKTDAEIKQYGFTDSVLISYAKTHDRLINPDREQFISEGLKLIEFIAEHRDTATVLNSRGLSISILIQAIKYRLGEIDYPSIGFERQLDFVNYITTKSKCRLVVKPPSDYRLVYNKVKLKSYVNLDPVDEFSQVKLNPHTLANYTKILAEDGAPFIKLPKLVVLHDMVTYMLSHPEKFHDVLFENMSNYLKYALDYENRDIRNGLSSLLATVAITQDDASIDFKQRRFTFQAEDTETAMDYLQNTIHEKLTRSLGSVDDTILGKLLSMDIKYNRIS